MSTRVGVVLFPGSNCEHDVVEAVRLLGGEADILWHGDAHVGGVDAVVGPGGFAHGDYLRPGATWWASCRIPNAPRAISWGQPTASRCCVRCSNRPVRPPRPERRPAGPPLGRTTGSGTAADARLGEDPGLDAQLPPRGVGQP